MPYTLTIKETVNLAGRTAESMSSVVADGIVSKDVTVDAAKTGQLTTRTDNDTGELTMAAGHGITTGARLDVYWTGGSRRGMTVGTVATNQVPIDGGDGDNLPANLTAVTAMVPREEEFVVTGDDVSAIELFSDKAGTIVIATAADAEVMARTIGGPKPNSTRSYLWTADRDPVNPVAGASVAKAFFSHSDSAASANMRAQMLYE